MHARVDRMMRSGRPSPAPRRVLVAALLATAVLSCGGDDPDPMGPDDSVSLTPASVMLTALGETAQLTATASDGSSPQWTSRSAGVATVSSTGLVTAVGQGSTWVVAEAGEASDSASVAVTQAPASFTVVSGDGQSGTVDEALPDPLVVQVQDANAHPIAMAGIVVAFAASEGGSVGDEEAETGADGTASTTWTLGTRATADGGVHTLSVRATGAEALEMTATAVAGPAAAIELQDGDEQYGYVGEALPEPVAVRVVDAHGNGVSGVAVSFAVVSGGGSPSASPVASDASGIASATWTLGSPEIPEAGYRLDSLRAISWLDGSPVTFHAETVREPGGTASIFQFGETGQLGSDGFGGGFDQVPENNEVTIEAHTATVTGVQADEIAPYSGLVSRGKIFFVVPLAACPAGGTGGGEVDVTLTVTVRGRTATFTEKAEDPKGVCPG